MQKVDPTNIPRKLPQPPPSSLAQKVSKVYASDLSTFVEMIFEKSTDSDDDLQGALPQKGPTRVVYNQKGFEAGQDTPPSSDPNDIVGAPLQLKPGVPIGYNIHLPKGTAKAIFVEVYGGNQKNEIKTRANKPRHLNPLDFTLIGQGIAVVTLNLVDFIKLDVHQADMPFELHKELHASINKFYEVLSKTPEQLSPLLTNLKGKPIYLYGASFGGRTAIRQAELYPHTFDGFMSHDGAIDNAMANVSDAKIILGGQRTFPAGTFIDAGTPAEIEKITRPILLLQNADDNNVNAKISTSWYNKAKKILGNKAPIQVLYTPQGNEIPIENDLHNKGHYLPTKPAALN